MKLLIISNMAHFQSAESIVGHGATVTEIDHLANLFQEVRHIGFLHKGVAPPSARSYSKTNIHLVPLPPAGGTSPAAKLKILLLSPIYILTILRELRTADVVHIRCPANIGVLAIVLLALLHKPQLRWVKYACNWSPNRKEVRSSKFQRWWLTRNFHHGWVTVNGIWPNQPPHVRSFINPCISEKELDEAEQLASEKNLSTPLQLLFVGLMHPQKGPSRALAIAACLRKAEVPFFLNLVGDGPAKAEVEALAKELGLTEVTRFHGDLPRLELNRLYVYSHIMVYPTDSSEGWPKVLSECMAYGVVPISGNVSSIPHYLQSYEIGKTFNPYDIDAFAQAVVEYLHHPEKWKKESTNGPKLARQFTYETYVQDVRNLLEL